VFAAMPKALRRRCDYGVIEEQAAKKQTR